MSLRATIKYCLKVQKAACRTVFDYLVDRYANSIYDMLATIKESLIVKQKCICIVFKKILNSMVSTCKNYLQVQISRCLYHKIARCKLDFFVISIWRENGI